MSGHTVWTRGLGTLALLALAGGCVSRAEYDRVEFARKTAVAHSDELEREVADARAQRNIIETERNALRRERDTKAAMVENLEAEKRRLGQVLDKTQEYADTALKSALREPDVITITKLPPELDKALRDFAQRYPGTVEYLPEKGMVRWKSDLTFALGSDVIREGANAALSEFANILNSAGANFEVVIVGHTDNVPVRANNKLHKDNWDLSCHRSISVMKALMRNGVTPDRMGVMGYGEFRPQVVNRPTGGEERNRRVEIFLVSSKDSFAAGGPATGTVGADDFAGTPHQPTGTPTRGAAHTRTPSRSQTPTRSSRAVAPDSAKAKPAAGDSPTQAQPMPTPPSGG